MREFERFSGQIVRVDGGGFGIVKFFNSISSADHGFFTEHTVNFDKMNGSLAKGNIIEGVVQMTDQHVLPVMEFDPARDH